MHADAMKPFGLALLDYYRGDKMATLTAVRDDGWRELLPVGTFFRAPEELEIERVALQMACGRVLDAGAGTGIHSKFLQDKGLAVCAIDILPQTIQIMQEQKLRDVRLADILSLSGEPFDTIIMLGHGIGMVENIGGLNHFLTHARKLVNSGGQILLTSLDVRVSSNPRNLAYHKNNTELGRYVGEIRMQFQYKDVTGPLFGWLHIDPETLKERSREFGWRCEVIRKQEDGSYLAKLSFNI